MSAKLRNAFIPALMLLFLGLAPTALAADLPADFSQAAERFRSGTAQGHQQGLDDIQIMVNRLFAPSSLESAMDMQRVMLDLSLLAVHSFDAETDSGDHLHSTVTLLTRRLGELLFFSKNDNGPMAKALELYEALGKLEEGTTSRIGVAVVIATNAKDPALTQKMLLSALDLNRKVLEDTVSKGETVNADHLRINRLHLLNYAAKLLEGKPLQLTFLDKADELLGELTFSEESAAEGYPPAFGLRLVKISLVITRAWLTDALAERCALLEKAQNLITQVHEQTDVHVSPQVTHVQSAEIEALAGNMHACARYLKEYVEATPAKFSAELFIQFSPILKEKKDSPELRVLIKQ